MKHPRRILDQYVADVKELLGVTNPQPFWHFRDYSKKLMPRLGSLRGIWRVQHMLSDILMMYHVGHAEIAAALTVQAQKTVGQVGLGTGDWNTASLLWPLQIHSGPTNEQARPKK